MAKTRSEMNNQNIFYKLQDSAERHLYMKVPSASPQAITKLRKQMLQNFKNSENLSKTQRAVEISCDDHSGVPQLKADSTPRQMKEINSILETIYLLDDKLLTKPQP